MSAKLEIYKSKSSGKQKGKWRARVVAANGKKLMATSEAYVRRRDVITALLESADAIQRFIR